MILQIIISNGILDLVTGILAKISLGTGIWAKFRLGTGIWYPPSRPSLFEVGSNSRLGAYSNEYGNYMLTLNFQGMMYRIILLKNYKRAQFSRQI